MFKNLLSFWKGKDFLTEVLEDFKAMLNQTKFMFESVLSALTKEKKDEELEKRIYEVDKNVNLLEREIRKRIIEHLAIQPSIDLPMSLILMSVVKDAERVGDYCKNLFEIIHLSDKPIKKEKLTEVFGDVDKVILGEFEKTEKAFLESDEKTAKEILNLEREVVKKCDIIVKNIAKSNMSTNEAVCMALMARYFKRIAAHLANIGTSVILPITDLDFFDERFRRDKTKD